MNETIEYLQTFARLPFALRRFLQHRLTLEEANRIVRERMEHREDNFLRMLERNVYGNPRSPYLKLLNHAGCELGDVRALVKQKEIEGALKDLRAAGVYVTFEEFKGRKPIVRKGTTIPVTARDFDNPFMQRDFSVQTGGSSGAAAIVGVDLDEIIARAPHEILALATHDLLDTPMIRWNGILPAGTIRNILRSVYIGKIPKRWFSQIGLYDSKYWFKYGMATYYILFWLRLFGVPVPLPEYVKVDEALIIARGVAETLQAHGRCLLFTNTSLALRVSLAAVESGIDMNGAIFRCGAEPPTLAKVAQIQRAGVTFLPYYGTVETSYIGIACAHATDASDVHLLKDAFILLSHPYTVDRFDITVPAFNLTTLLSTAPKLMINMQMDDYGIIEERTCGCLLESFGFTTHLRDIRSYNKLTGEGVTLIGNELERILEKVLPEYFGGSPLDYQLLEEEDEQGLTRAYLIVSPRVELADEDQVITVLLNALRESSPMADAVRTIWQQAQTIQIRRTEPIASGRKFLPLSIQRRPKGDPSRGDT